MTNQHRLMAGLQARLEDYRRAGEIVPGTRLAQQLTDEFPGSGLTAAEVADLIVLEAARAGVALEVGE